MMLSGLPCAQKQKAAVAEGMPSIIKFLRFKICRYRSIWFHFGVASIRYDLFVPTSGRKIPALESVTYK